MLFVYGTLQDEDVLAAILGRRTKLAQLLRATAPGYRAIAYPGRVYPALAAAPGDSAPGLLIDGLSALDMAALDAFEGAEYIRSRITVQTEAGEQIADAYLPVVTLSPLAPAWSLQHWTRQHKPAALAGEVHDATAIRARLTGASPR